ncbi:MAG: YicC/YloC family endoribonuclease, partial [Planctomycetota bacterium]
MAGIASMTGFGRATRETPDETFEVEVRAVNNRSLKVQPRLSESASALAARVEHHVRERVARGTVYVTVKHRRRGGAAAHRLDEKLLCKFFEALQELEKELTGGAERKFNIAEVAALPGVVTTEESLEDDL